MKADRDSRFDPDQHLIDGGREDAKRELLATLRHLFPRDADALFRLCLHRIDYPLGYGHLRWFVGAVGPQLDERTTADLRIGYVLLCSYYFLLDAVVDDHLDNRGDVPYLAHLLAGAVQLLTRACVAVDPSSGDQAADSIRDHISGNAASVRAEITIRADPTYPLGTQLEWDSIVGRSNPSLLLYHLVCLIAKVPPSQTFVRSFKGLLFWLQYADDLGDWRSDYRAGQWTSVLREARLRTNRKATEDDLETAMLLDGVYESLLARIINGLAAVHDEFDRQREIDGRELCRFVLAQRNRIHGVLSDFVEKKLGVISKERKPSVDSTRIRTESN